MHPFLMKQQIDYGIFIIEQAGKYEYWTYYLKPYKSSQFFFISNTAVCKRLYGPVVKALL